MLVKAAHSANIKERRDASCALFDADGQMVMQAEHIPVHLGAMPDAVAAVAGRGPLRRHAVGAQRPVRGRHAPARHHGHHARCSTTASCSASPPAAPTTPTSAARRPARCRPTRTTLEDEGVVISPQPARRRRDRAAGAADAPAGPAPRRPARPARRQPHRRQAAGRAARAARRRTACATRWPRPSTTPSAGCAPAWPSSRTASTRRRDVLEARRRRPRAAPDARRRRRRADARLHRLAPTSTTATSTARWRSPAPPAGSPCACSPTPTSRPPPARCAR